MIRRIFNVALSHKQISCRFLSSFDSFLAECPKNRRFTETDGYVWKSPYNDPIDDNQSIFHHYMWKNLDVWKDKIALECSDTGRNYTYSRFRDSCAIFAVRLLTTYGLKKGDVIALILPNLPEYLIALLGANEVGIIVTPLNPASTPYEISRQISASKPKIIITTNPSYTNIEKACEIGQISAKKIVVKTAQNESCPIGAADFHELISAKDVNFDALNKIIVQPDDVCLLPFSSGTTGLPKGVMLTHRNFVYETHLYNAKNPIEPLSRRTTKDYQETILGFLPFFHIAGLANVAVPKLQLGMKVVTYQAFKFEKFAEELIKHQVPVQLVVPPILIGMANRPDITEKHLRSLRTLICGASNIGELDVKRLLQKNPSLDFIQAYGLTETCGCTTIAPSNSKNYSSIGFAAAGVEVKVRRIDDPNNIGVDSNIVGELLIRGANNMIGYYKNEDATREVLSADGWLRTGDLGSIDENGYIYIKDRLKELIKVKGFQVAPAELEELLRDHPMVNDAAVVGIEDSKNGEIPKAFIVRKTNSKVTEQELKDYVASKVIEYKQLRGGIVFIDSIPKTASGKILRKDLKNL